MSGDESVVEVVEKPKLVKKEPSSPKKRAAARCATPTTANVKKPKHVDRTASAVAEKVVDEKEEKKGRAKGKVDAAAAKATGGGRRRRMEVCLLPLVPPARRLLLLPLRVVKRVGSCPLLPFRPRKKPSGTKKKRANDSVFADSDSSASDLD